jgi:hypothetical protein
MTKELKGWDKVEGGHELAIVQPSEMVARFDALRTRIGHQSAAAAVDARIRLDARLLEHIEFRASELIDALLA